MIQVTFTNATAGTDVELKWVRSVEWQSNLDEGAKVGKTVRRGHRTRTYTIRGFVNKSMFADNVSTQEALESELMAVGVGTLAITNAADITDARFTSLSIEEFRGNPVVNFTVTFVTEEANIHAHTPVRIGSLTLSPANGFESPAVEDMIRTQGDDEQLVNNRARTFRIAGDIVGDSAVDVESTQADLVAAVENLDTVVITVTTGQYTVRVRSLKFGAPRLLGDNNARSYSFECATYEDYTKEPFNLGHSQENFAGITLDVVDSVDYNTDRIYGGTVAYYQSDESMVVTGKKYFDGFTAYKAFRDLFDPIPTSTYLYVSASGNTLELDDIAVGEMRRDGNSTADNAKRYSANITLNFTWRKSLSTENLLHGATIFGVEWHKFSSVNFTTSVDEYGNITSRGMSVSGSVIGASRLNALRDLTGTPVTYELDSGVFKDMYVTSVNGGSQRIIGTVAGQTNFSTDVEIDVSVNCQQLDNASQAIHFLDGLFEFSKAGGAGTSYAGDTVLFDDVNSRSKSISNRFDTQTQQFIVTSINFSVSGDVFETDSGSGGPANPDKIYDIFNKIDALLTADQSAQGSANTHGGNELLPDNNDIHYMLNNINVGKWQPFTKETGTGAGQRYWKQSVSISATAVFDLAGGGSNTQPDLVTTKSVSTQKQALKYTQVQVLNQGTVFKVVGTTPEKQTVTFQARWRTEQLYRDANLSGLTFPNEDISPVGAISNADNEITAEKEENRGLVNRKIVEYTATEKIS